MCILLFFLSGKTLANQFCFATAENYYQQVYCELAYKGQTKNLPSYDDFKKNSEAIQFTLLRRIAEKNKIDFPPPHKSAEIKTDATKIATKPAERNLNSFAVFLKVIIRR